MGEKWQNSMSRLTESVRLWLEKIWNGQYIQFYLYYVFIYTVGLVKHTLFIDMYQVGKFCFQITETQSKQAGIFKEKI